MPLAVDRGHRVVPADKPYSQSAAVYHITDFVRRRKLSAALPDVVAHHERELHGERLALVKVHARHRAYGLYEYRLRLPAHGVLVGARQEILRLVDGLYREPRHVHRGERKVAPAH